MLINLRNALMAGKRLPYDAEVEYLQSSGTQYINTGVKFTADNARVKFTASVTYASDKALCGSQNHSAENNYGFVCYLYSNAMRIYAGTSNTGATASLVDGNAHTVDLQANSGTLTKTIDGTISTHNYNGTIVSGEDFTIFTSWRVSGSSMTARCVSAKIYAFQIWNNGVLVRDYIPVRKGTVGYLYDRVSGKLFGNAGSGDFVLGPDVVPVEYIESHGTEWIDTGVDASLCNTEEMTIKCNFAVTGTGGPGGQYNGVFGAAVPRFGVYTIGQNLSWGYYAPHDNVKSFTFGNWVDSTCVFSKNNQSATFDEETFTASNPTVLTSLNIGFFCRNVATGPQWLALARIKNCDIEATSARRHFRAVRVGTEGAMMDVLTRRIYRNAGTGAFAYGNDLKYPIPA